MCRFARRRNLQYNLLGPIPVASCHLGSGTHSWPRLNVLAWRVGTSTMNLVGTVPTSFFPLHPLKLGVTSIELPPNDAWTWAPQNLGNISKPHQTSGINGLYDEFWMACWRLMMAPGEHGVPKVFSMFFLLGVHHQGKNISKIQVRLTKITIIYYHIMVGNSK